MKIRQATFADVPALNRLVNSAYRGEGSKAGWTTEADLLEGIRTSEAALTEMLRRGGALILAAETKNELQGCVYLQVQNEALLSWYANRCSTLQGRGLGAQLMAAAEERAHQLGCTKMRMTVITVREALIGYYRRKGYNDTGKREPFPTDPKFGIPKQPLEFMVMEKSLGPLP